MPPTISSVLLRSEPLTDEEQVRILQERLHALHSMIRSTTLGKLRYLDCLRHDGLGGHTHTVALDYYTDPGHWDGAAPPFEVDSDMGDGLDVEGRFQWHWSYASHHGEGYGNAYTLFHEAPDIPDGHTYVWGVGRYGHWVLVRIDFLGRRDRSYRWEAPTKVTIRRSSPEEIAQALPANQRYRFSPLVDFLTELAKAIEGRRARQHQEAQEVLAGFRAEDRLIAQLPGGFFPERDG